MQLYVASILRVVLFLCVFLFNSNLSFGNHSNIDSLFHLLPQEQNLEYVQILQDIADQLEDRDSIFQFTKKVLDLSKKQSIPSKGEGCDS